MALALLSLAGLFVALYLHLFKVGLIGSLACGTGGCETVQLSPQSRFLGVGVAFIGVLGYAGLLGLSLLALQPRFAGVSWPIRMMGWLSILALGFTGYLTYLELFVIHAICRYCVGSAVIILLICLLSLVELRRARPAAA